MREGIFVIAGPGSLKSGADSAGTTVVGSRSALLVGREGESLAQQSSKQVRRGLHAGLRGIDEGGLQGKMADSHARCAGAASFICECRSRGSSGEAGGTFCASLFTPHEKR